MPIQLDKRTWSSLQRELFLIAMIHENLNILSAKYQELALVDYIKQEFNEAVKEMLYAETMEELNLHAYRLTALMNRIHTKIQAERRKSTEFLDDMALLDVIESKLEQFISHRRSHLEKIQESHQLEKKLGWIIIDVLLMITSIVIGFDIPDCATALITVSSLALAYNTFDFFGTCAAQSLSEAPEKISNHGLGDEHYAPHHQNCKKELQELYQGIDPLSEIDDLLMHQSTFLAKKQSQRSFLKKIALTLALLGFAFALIGLICTLLNIPGAALFATLLVVGASITIANMALSAYQARTEHLMRLELKSSIDEKILQDEAIIQIHPSPNHDFMVQSEINKMANKEKNLKTPKDFAPSNLYPIDTALGLFHHEPPKMKPEPESHLDDKNNPGVADF